MKTQETLENLRVITLDDKPYFNLNDVLTKVVPTLFFEHLLLNSLFPPEGQTCLIDYIAIEYEDEEEFNIIELDPAKARQDPWMKDEEIYIDKAAALAILCDFGDQDYLIKKIKARYGLSDEDKREIFMLKGNLWTATQQEAKEISGRLPEEYKEYRKYRPRTLDRFPFLKTDWDRLGLC